MVQRLFYSPYKNSHFINASAPVETVLKAMNAKSSAGMGSKVYNLMTESNGDRMIASYIEENLRQTENHPVKPRAFDTDVFNIVAVNASIIPPEAINSLKMHKVALIPENISSSVADALPDHDNFIAHMGRTTPELHETAKLYMKGLGFDV